MTDAEVGRKTVRAALWAFLSAIGKRAMTLIGLTILARILAPHDFGLLGFAMVYITFAETIGDLGTSMALVYWPDRRDDAAQVTFICNVIAGIFWCVVTLLLAPYIAHFFHAPYGVDVVRALSPALLLKALGNTHDALAQKDLRFKARVIPEVALTFAKALIAIVLGLLGFGVWSLVWGQLGALATWTVLLWIIVPWRPTLRWPKDLFGPILRYGKSLVAVNVLAAFMFDIDLAVVGRYLGVTALGLYEMAGRVPEASVMVLLWVVSKVLFPAFSALHAEGKDVSEAYLVAVRAVSALTLPASLGLVFLSRPIMLVFFGQKWVAAAPILSAVALYVLARSFDHHAGDVLKATGRAHLLAYMNSFKTVAVVPAVIIGAHYSAVAVAYAMTIVYAAATVLTLIIAARIIKVKFSAIMRAFLPSIEAGAVMTAVLIPLVRWTPQYGAIFELAAGVIVGAIVYFIVLRFTDPQLFLWAKHMLTSNEPQETAEELLRHAG